jgi:hypothetical protein
MSFVCFVLPQGVLRLGGTFAVDGGAVLFAHSDGVPGDHPNVADVIDALRTA